MVSVNTSNQISSAILTGGMVAAFGALGAKIIGSPIGAMGGALFGAGSYVFSRPIASLTNKVLNQTHPAASRETKVVSFVINQLGSWAATWAAFNLVGVSLTFRHAVCLGLAGLIPCILLAGVLYVAFDALSSHRRVA